jgi:hypothetical protein
MNQEDTWKYAAFGKHPAAKDFIKFGTDTSILDGFADWVDDGYVFAGSDTRVWITSIGLEPGRHVDGQVPMQQSTSDGAGDMIAREIGNARKLVKKGRGG